MAKRILGLAQKLLSGIVRLLCPSASYTTGCRASRSVVKIRLTYVVCTKRGVQKRHYYLVNGSVKLVVVQRTKRAVKRVALIVPHPHPYMRASDALLARVRWHAAHTRA
eukprot:6172011-Pleurochrysis_carterae.AAC.3